MNHELAKQLQENVRAFYEQHGTWFATTRGKILPEQAFVATYIKPGMTVVDVGAGNGRLAKLLPDGTTYLGVEPSETLRRACHAPNPTSVRRGVSYSDSDSPPYQGGVGGGGSVLAGELPVIPLSNQTADVTTCLAVLHHIPTRDTRRASVEELIRLTKLGGIILATAWLQNPHGDATTPVANGEPGDRWMPWDGPDGQAMRYVHFMQPDEWEMLWTHPALEILRIGMHGKRDWTNDVSEALNWRVLARRR